MKTQLKIYTSSNAWANQKIGKVLSDISLELIDKEIVSSFSSIRKTVYHIWDAEEIWLSRLQGISLDYWPHTKLSGKEPIDSFVKKSIEYDNYVETLSEKELLGNLDFKSTSGETYTMPISGVIMHTMNHSSFHRGQLITLLRQVGISDLPGTDLIKYLREINQSQV